MEEMLVSKLDSFKRPLAKEFEVHRALVIAFQTGHQEVMLLQVCCELELRTGFQDDLVQTTDNLSCCEPEEPGLETSGGEESSLTDTIKNDHEDERKTIAKVLEVQEVLELSLVSHRDPEAMEARESSERRRSWTTEVHVPMAVTEAIIKEREASALEPLISCTLENLAASHFSRSMHQRSSFTPKMQSRRMGTSGRTITKSTSMSGEIYKLEHNDGSQSDTAVGTVGTGGKKRRSSLSAKVVAIVSRRSRSTSQLSQTEAGHKKLKSTIQRSTETGMAAEMRSRMVRQPSRESTDGSINSYSSEGNLIFPGVRLGADSQFSDFLDGLGPAQLVGRQTLATPAMGDIQIGMVDKKGQLEVEVIRARGLIQKPGSKSTPAPYVKVYLLENGACIAKKKTRIARKTLDPLYQQSLVFDESPLGKVLQ
ncbi:regulating synaptic membrane exocytosis protein 1-like, partial [Microcaecilia unicolor]|uniref:Regulating synaptic membrane exocytosis protein 1-like n=1 Tax=Microcaecilia unicolor TaxID=1415580 RepID=A0A6P7WN59_9AMPH